MTYQVGDPDHTLAGRGDGNAMCGALRSTRQGWQAACTLPVNHHGTDHAQGDGNKIVAVWQGPDTIRPIVVTTRDQLRALDPGTVVLSADQTLAGRYDDQRGVVLGDERPVPWEILELPALVLWPLNPARP